MKFRRYIKSVITESIDDMHRRCEVCNTLLNDGGTCPKCDDGEEDYEDKTELDESCSSCSIKPFGARWFAAYDSDGKIITDDGAPRVFTTEAAANEFLASYTPVIVEEVLSVREKLKKAYPELNFDKELTEAVASDSIRTINDALKKYAQDTKHDWASTLSTIIDVIPDTQIDELFDNVSKSFDNVKLNTDQQNTILDSANVDKDSVDTSTTTTLGKLLSAIDIVEWSKKNPKLVKGVLITILGVIAVIEPTPVVELIIAALMVVPDSIIGKLVSALNLVTNPAAAGIHALSKRVNEELSNKEKLKLAYPELNFDNNTETVEEGLLGDVVTSVKNALNIGESVEEESEEDLDTDYMDYDDDYDIDDDVEQDRRHAALYGGDRMYCDCGTKLAYDEYGSYCPNCEPEHNMSL